MFGFEDFFQHAHGGMGGMPGMGGGMGGMGMDEDDGPSTESTKYYEILGVEKNATQSQIKKAYKKKARDLHPDRHQTEKEKYEKLFQDLTQAYEVLSDPDKRTLYDRYGEAGLKGGASSGGMGDLFDVLFGGGGGGRRRSSGRSRQQKAPPIKVPMDVTMEDLYIGATKKLEIKRYRKCAGCDGKGGKKVITCNECNGSGYQHVVQRMGMMTMRTQRPCSTCDGEGQTIPPKDKCRRCEGKGLQEEEKKLDVSLPMGAKHAESITLRNQGHDIPDAATGDVIVFLRVQKHPVFRRIGADLAITHSLSLKEALCGYDIKINHLSRTVLNLKSKEGEVTQPGQLKRVYGWGMPQKGASHVKGHLYVRFEVKFPQPHELSDDLVTRLEELLPDGGENYHDDQKERPEPTEDVDMDDPGYGEIYEEHVTADDVEGEPEVTPASSRSQYDEDDEQDGNVQCRQM